jgi:hypothetical protein
MRSRARPFQRPNDLSLLIVGLAMVASAALLAYWGRGQWFSSEDLNYGVRLATQPLGHALLHPPPNKYLIAFPLLVYRALFEAFGLHSYVPYRVTGIVLGLLCAGLLFALLRRRLPDRFALPPTLLMLFFGSGWEVIATPIRIPSQIALAAGLGMLLALERRDRRGDLAATLLLGISLASHPVGISFAATGAVVIILGSRAGWRRLWVIAIPGVLFAAWWLFLRPPELPSFVPNRPADVFVFVRQSWVALTAAVSGLFGVIPEPTYAQAAAKIAAVALGVLILVGIGYGWRRLPPMFWGALVGLVVLMATTRLSPAGFLRVPGESRYLYPEAFFLLLALGALAGALKLSSWALWAGSAVLLVSLWPNIDRLHDGGRSFSRGSEIYRVQWSAAEIAQPDALPGYRPDRLSPHASDYFATVRAFGKGGFTPSALAGKSEELRQLADANLAAALGLELSPSARPARGNDCRSASGEVTLPSGGAWLDLRGIRGVSLRLRRFADRPTVALSPPRGAEGVDLRIPPDQSTVRWRMLGPPGDSIPVCGLAPSSQPSAPGGAG